MPVVEQPHGARGVSGWGFDNGVLHVAQTVSVGIGLHRLSGRRSRAGSGEYSRGRVQQRPIQHRHHHERGPDPWRWRRDHARRSRDLRGRSQRQLRPGIDDLALFPPRPGCDALRFGAAWRGRGGRLGLRRGGDERIARRDRERHACRRWGWSRRQRRPLIGSHRCESSTAAGRQGGTAVALWCS